MPKCEVCGNEYDKAFQVKIGRKLCGHCGCKVIGHGAEANGAVFCCAHWANYEGVRGIKDRL